MLRIILSLLVMSFSINFYGQLPAVNAVDNRPIDPRITEVFGNQLSVLVLQDKDRRNALEDLLTRRIEIVELIMVKDEKLPKLSSIPLFNRYNPDLKRDENFNPATFNVLKYDLPFYSQYQKMFRIDNTNYVISILPKKRSQS